MFTYAEFREFLADNYHNKLTYFYDAHYEQFKDIQVRSLRRYLAWNNNNRYVKLCEEIMNEEMKKGPVKIDKPEIPKIVVPKPEPKKAEYKTFIPSWVFRNLDQFRNCLFPEQFVLKKGIKACKKELKLNGYDCEFYRRYIYKVDVETYARHPIPNEEDLRDYYWLIERK